MVVSVILSSCKTDYDTDVATLVITSGEADFSNYVALGNSLTSGYRDDALFINAQEESYPNIIAQQMKRAGGGTFTQPLMLDNIGGFSNLNMMGKLTLKVVDGDLSPVPTPATSPFTPISGAFNNMGVPGAKSFHLLVEGYGNPDLHEIGSRRSNPYFARFASSPLTSVLKDAMAKKPTFFSLWIGNNDVLSYATSGGVGMDRTGNLDPRTYGYEDITDPQVLKASIKGVLDGLKAVDATKGVIANIPNVENIPFFTTIPTNYLTPYVLGKKNQAQGEVMIDQLNQSLYGVLNQVLTQLGHGDRIKPLSKTKANPFLMKDETLEDLSNQISVALSPVLGVQTARVFGMIFGQARQTKEGDLILLTTKNDIGKQPDKQQYPYAQQPLNAYGITFPLQDKHVLIPSEITAIKNATTAYNTHIKQLADDYGLAFVDANAKMKSLSQNSGIQFDGVRYTTSFATGGAFSLDAVHLTGRGYAVIANEFIHAINVRYQSTLPKVNPNKYSGIQFP